MKFSTVQFSHSVMFDSLQPHEPQHTRLPCPSPTPGVHPNYVYMYIHILKCFSCDSDSCPSVGIGPLLQFPCPLRAGPDLLTLLLSLSSFVLLSFAWFFVFFSAGQVLLSALSWCSASTSVPEDVFLLYPWREMYSTATYSSTILFSLQYIF